LHKSVPSHGKRSGQGIRNLHFALAHTTQDEARAELSTIVAKDPSDLTETDFRSVRSLVSIITGKDRPSEEELRLLIPEGADLVFRRALTSFKPLDYDEIASHVYAHHVRSDDDAKRWFNAARKRFATGAQPEWDRFIWKLVTDRNPSALSPKTVDEAADLLEAIGTHTGETPLHRPFTRKALELIEQHVSSIKFARDSTAVQRSIAADVQELTVRNIRRIRGENIPTADGMSGYQNFPDYAEIGEIVTGIRTLDALSPSSKIVTW
jgi:hypothetical protein